MQPLRKEDGSIAKTDTDMAELTSAVFGEEILEVQKDKFKQREEEEVCVLYQKETESIKKRLYHPNPINEDFTIEEVSNSIQEMDDGTTPNPYEKVFTLMIKKVVTSLWKLYIDFFSIYLAEGLIPQTS